VWLRVGKPKEETFAGNFFGLPLNKGVDKMDGMTWANAIIMGIGLVVIGVAYLGATWEVLKRVERK